MLFIDTLPPDWEMRFYLKIDTAYLSDASIPADNNRGKRLRREVAKLDAEVRSYARVEEPRKRRFTATRIEMVEPSRGHWAFVSRTVPRIRSIKIAPCSVKLLKLKIDFSFAE